MIYVIILAGIVIFATFVFYMSWKKKKIMNVFKDMQMSGETFVLGPEIASFRGATAKYGRIKCDGVIGMTSEEIIFIPFVGNRMTIMLNQLKGVGEKKNFLGSHRAGIPVLVLHSKEADIGFFVRDILRWQNTIKGIIK